jgi:YVTN family beta-propeller protein
MKSVATIKDLNSPRNMLVINSEKAYVTSLFSNEITILDLRTNTVAGKINIRRSSEAILMSGTKAYVSCWSAGKEIMVINTLNNMVIDSLEVGVEPESMVLDKQKKLWILCTGGYTGKFSPELVAVNTINNKIENRFTFPEKLFNPSSLVINSTGDTLYYICGSLWKMGIMEPALPAEPFAESKGRLFYKIGAEPGTSTIYATNAVDYQQKGYLLRIKPDGTIIDSVRTEVIPGSIFFKSY